MLKSLSVNYFRIRSKSFYYKKAMPQPERGGRTWRVVTDMVKHDDGRVSHTVYESGLTSKHKAMQLARVLNSYQIR
jgi:hypothetical protein